MTSITRMIPGLLAIVFLMGILGGLTYVWVWFVPAILGFTALMTGPIWIIPSIAMLIQECRHRKVCARVRTLLRNQ